MSKPVKDLIQKELVKRLNSIQELAVIGFTGIDAQATRAIRGRLREKSIRLTVVKNSIARQAFKQCGMEAAGEAMDGPCALAYGGDGVVTIVRELLAISKETPQLTVKAALLEGEVFGADRMEQLSKYPTREEAVGKVVAAIFGPGAKLAACLIGPGAKLASILKSIEEKAEKAAPEAAPEAAPAASGDAAAPTA